MIFASQDQRRMDDALRELLADGRTLGEALRELHGVRRVGLLWLSRAVATVCGLPGPEAKRAVVRETFDLCHPDRAVTALPNARRF